MLYGTFLNIYNYVSFTIVVFKNVLKIKKLEVKSYTVLLSNNSNLHEM